MLPEWDRFVTAVKLNRGLETSNYDQLYAYLKQHEAHANENKIMLERYNQHAIDPLSFGRQNRGHGNNVRGAVAARNGGFQNRVSNANPAQENGMVLDEEKLFFIAGGQTNMFDDDVDEAPVQDLALNEDNVQDHDNYLDNVGEYHEVYEMQNNVQQNYIVDSDAEYTSDSNIIPYEQYVKDNTKQVVQSNVSFVPNDALMMIINEMHEQAAQYVSTNEHNKVVNASLTAELARYKEQVMIYEKRERFESTEREQKIDKQMRIIITDLKTNHACAVMHDSEDTLEIAEITRKRMLKKVKIPLCVEKKVKIAQPDYSKENYLATFTLERHLTLEQIF
ncbi:hypothetical protein Tco_0956634 [Tanacetum coccineum]